jgi:hypothetical protein
MIAETKQRVDGLAILRAAKFNFELAATIIALNDDNWRELLDSIPPTDLRAGVEPLVHQIRAALGKDRS